MSLAQPQPHRKDATLAGTAEAAAPAFRLEADFLGSIHVPSNAYYGAQTARALANFKVTGRSLAELPELLSRLAMVKKAAALSNRDCGDLSPRLADAIASACDEVIEGEWLDHFPLDPVQGGAGTSTNMNMNEVVAGRANEILAAGGAQEASIHPNDHVNRSQSTNDAYATAARLAADCLMSDLATDVATLIEVIERKAATCDDVAKLGRTQLQDAVPMTAGEELRAFASSLRGSQTGLAEAQSHLLAVNLGGTAIGTGVGATAEYRVAALRHLATISGRPVRAAQDSIAATSDAGDLVACASAAKQLAIRLGKIANDLRLLSSGPRGGIGELRLPAMQPGSSIMPGKINPVIPELVNQICYRAFGHELTVSLAAEAAQLQLNAMFPTLYLALSDMISELRAACQVLAERCIENLAVDEAQCRANLDASTALAVNLLPALGYAETARIARQALTTGLPFLAFLSQEHPELVERADPARPGATTR